jgi:hypothetical protein
MHLTRFGFNMLVIIYLAPLLFIDLIGNMMYTDAQSDYFYYKALLDGCLLAYSIYQLTRPATTSLSNAKARAVDTMDEIVSFESLGAMEYIYCLMLSAYSAVNWYFLHDLNKHSTGLVSMGTMIWSILSIAVAVVAIVQFWHLKSGNIVELKKKVLQ